MSPSMSDLSILLAAASIMLASPAVAHTWNEQLALIGSDGNYTGSFGYPRGYTPRTSSNFNETESLWQLPKSGTAVTDSDLVCPPWAQTPNQSPGFPTLAAYPGAYIAMRYLENGHVTQPFVKINKPGNDGTVYVFGTTQPKAGETLANVLSWSKTGDLSTGRLLAVQNYDDGRCHQISSADMAVSRAQEFPDPAPGATPSEMWCETDVQIPTDASASTPLTLYWIWDWPTLPTYNQTSGIQEWYTACSDINIKAEAPGDTEVSNNLLQQDANMAAVSGYSTRTANPSYTIPSFSMWADLVSQAEAFGGQPGSVTLPTAAALGSPTSSIAASASASASLSTQNSAMPTASSSAKPSASLPTAATIGQSAFVSSSASASITPVAAAGPTTVTSYIAVTAVLTPGQDATVVMGSYSVTMSLDAAPTNKVKRGLKEDVLAGVDGGHRYRMKQWKA